MSDGHGLSASELELLTDEERAGLESGEFDEDDDGDDNGGETDDGDDANEDVEGDDDSSDESDDSAEDNNVNAGGEADDDDDDAALSQINAADRIDVAASQTRIEAIAAEQLELANKLDDGEITTTEFVKANKALEREESDLAGKVARQTENDDAVTKVWFGDVNKFLEKNPELKANETRLRSFDEVVRRVTGDPEHAELSNRKQLELAHNLWREELGIPTSAKASDGKSGKPDPKPRAEIPPTLHNVPAAEMSDSDDSKFAYLDGLITRDPLGFEKALGTLSPADQQDYLSRG